ncbi:MAG: hypothetical protein D6689_06280 [Deltaproteobacteria bacterium]|nr:MAG: hypothetical protein D6689_06280 [Deltaproteobacteria bacterium]
MGMKPRVRIAKPPILFAKTQKLVAALQRELGAPLIAYWTSPNGSVCHNDVTAIYEILDAIGEVPELYLAIKSDGGSGEAALRIINLLRQHADRLVALVTRECASAATMMALGADEIRMGPLAYLTAVDTSLRHELSPADIDNDLVSVSQDELLRVIRLWKQSATAEDSNPYKTLFKYVHPLVVGAVDRSSSLSVKLCQEILGYHIPDERKALAIAEHLNSAYPSHEYPITLREAERIGLKVAPLDRGINDLLLELTELHAEMGQRALTDYDEFNYHSHEIGNILEGLGIQVFYQRDKDWHYRREERRWVPMNDKSAWKKVARVGRRVETSVLHLR